MPIHTKIDTADRFAAIGKAVIEMYTCTQVVSAIQDKVCEFESSPSNVDHVILPILPNTLNRKEIQGRAGGR